MTLFTAQDWRCSIKRAMRSVVISIWLLIGFAGGSVADDGAGLEDILGGFEGENSAASYSNDDTGTKKSRFDFSGSATLASAYNYAHKKPAKGKTDYRGLSRLRSELELAVDIKISGSWKAFISARGFYDLAYTINGRDRYTDQTLDTYEDESEFRDSYIQGTLTKKLDIKVGRQIVVWGKSDNARVTDILNPLDNREPGMVDIEDLRLPVTMTKLDYYFGDLSLTAIAIHEIRFNKNPAFGSDFYPFDIQQPDEEKPSNDIDNTEYAFAFNGIFTGWDMSFYFARYFDDDPRAANSNAAGAGPFVLRHSRLTMVGSAMNIAIGNWLVKAEAAYIDGLEFFGADRSKSRYDLLAGLEYYGFTDTIISIEAVNRHIADFETSMKNQPDSAIEDQFQSFIRYSRDFYNQTVHLLFLGSLLDYDGSDGAFYRVSIRYDVMDAFSITSGIVGYESGDNQFFKNMGDNDRVFLDAKYSF